MQHRIAALQRVKGDEQILLSDANMQVSAIKCLGGEKTVVCVFVSNKTNSPLPAGDLQVAGDVFTVEVESDAAVQPRAGANNAVVVSLPSLRPHQTLTLLLSLALRPASLPLASAGAFSLSLSLSHSAMVVGLNAVEMVRAAPIASQAYGQHWKTHNKEAKVQVRLSCVHNSAEFMSRVRSELHMHPVQTIGQENIVAGRVLVAAPSPVLCLVHGKVTGDGVNPAQLDVIVRSQSSELTHALTKAITAAMKQ